MIEEKEKREEKEENENVVSMVSMMHWGIALSVTAPGCCSGLWFWSVFMKIPLDSKSEGLTFIDFKLRDSFFL